MNGDCTVLVTSCDSYRDVEGAFLSLWRKFWPDCPFELTVVSETGAEDGFDRVIVTGRGKSWSEMLVEALDRISTPYVIMLMNDYYLNAPVDTALVLERLREAKSRDALNYRLCPDPPQAIKNTAYSVSCKAGIWNREFLRGLASRTGDAWEFERRGSYMFDEDDKRPLLVSERLEFPFVDAVHKGFWEREALTLMEQEGVDCDWRIRGLPPFRVRMIEAVKKIIFSVSPDLVTRLQNALTAEKGRRR